MKRILSIALMLLSMVSMAQIGQISNGESGSSVRGKLNQVIDSINTNFPRFQLLAPDGSASNPSYGFENQPSTGMFLQGTSNLQFNVAGAAHLSLAPTIAGFPSAGISFLDGSIFLNEKSSAAASTAANGQLYVRDDTPNVLVFVDDAGSETVISGGTPNLDEVLASGGFITTNRNLNFGAFTLRTDAFLGGGNLLGLVDGSQFQYRINEIDGASGRSSLMILTGVQAQMQYIDNDNTANNADLALNPNGIVFNGGANFAGAEYQSDFSANYTNRSLVDKEYVDGLAGISFPLLSTTDGTAGAPAYGFTSNPGNGIYKTGSNAIGISAGSSIRVNITNSAATFYEDVRPNLNASASLGVSSAAFSETYTEGITLGSTTSTGTSRTMAAEGLETDVDIDIVSKGAGQVLINGAALDIVVVSVSGSTAATESINLTVNPNVETFRITIDQNIDDSNYTLSGHLCKALSASVVFGAQGFTAAGSGLDSTPVFSLSGSTLTVDLDGLSASAKDITVHYTELTSN